MDVGHHAAACDRHFAQKLGKLLVVPHGELDVPRNDPALLVVPCCVSGELQNLFRPLQSAFEAKYRAKQGQQIRKPKHDKRNDNKKHTQIRLQDSAKLV